MNLRNNKEGWFGMLKRQHLYGDLKKKKNHLRDLWRPHSQREPWFHVLWDFCQSFHRSSEVYEIFIDNSIKKLTENLLRFPLNTKAIRFNINSKYYYPPPPLKTKPSPHGKKNQKQFNGNVFMSIFLSRILLCNV